MSCNIRIPLQQIIDDVAAALSDGFIKTDNAVLTEAVLNEVTIRGDISVDTAARNALCAILQTCGITAIELEWLDRPTVADMVAVSEVVAGEVVVSWKDLDTLITEGIVGKVQTTDVLDSLGVSQEEINTDIRNELDALPFEEGVLADTFVIATANGDGTVARTQRAINAEKFTPYDFGAIGDGTYHPLSEKYETLALAQAVYPHAESLTDSIDSMALEAMVEAVRNTRALAVDVRINGRFYLTKTLEFIVKDGGGGIDQQYYMDASFDVGFTGDNAITIHGINTGIAGFIRITGNDRVLYGIVVSSRAVNGGVDYINSGISLPKVHVNDVILFAIQYRNNSMFSTLDYLRTGGCGTPSNALRYGKTSEAVVSNQVTSGAGSIEGISKFTVDTLPEHFDKTHILVSYNGFAARVIAVDEETKIVTVRPNIPTPSTHGTLKYHFGGSVEALGSDSAGIHIKHLSGIMGGSLLQNHSMYPIVVDYAASEFSGVAFYSTGLVGGIDARTVYFEGDAWQYLQYKDAVLVYGSSVFGHCTALELDKWDNIRFGRNLNGSPIAGYGGLPTTQLVSKGVTYAGDTTKQLGNGLGGAALDFNKPDENHVYYTDGKTFEFETIIPSANRLFGYDSQSLTVIGTGNNGRPMGAVGFAPPAGYTVNGSSSPISFTGFSAAASFTLLLVVATKNILISCSTQVSMPLSPTASLGARDTNTLPMDSLYWFESGATNVGLPKSSQNSIPDGTIATYFAKGTTGIANTITQVVTFPALGETWQRMNYSYQGVYLAWQLVDYTIRKGDTANRPAITKLGMVYYDTTLLAEGKPISWNGSTWVDAMGVVV